MTSSFCVAGECQILYRGRRSHNEVVDLSMAVYGVGDRNYVSPLYSACPLACQVLSKVCSFLSSLSPRLACAMLCYACVRWQVRHVSYAWLWCVQCGTLNLCFVLFLHKAVPKSTWTKHHGWSVTCLSKYVDIGMHAVVMWCIRYTDVIWIYIYMLCVMSV